MRTLNIQSALLGEVVDKEGLRLQVLSQELPAGLLRDVRVAESVPSGDTILLRFAAESVSVGGSKATVQAPYGQPVEIDGVRFTVTKRPREVNSAAISVIPREAGR